MIWCSAHLYVLIARVCLVSFYIVYIIWESYCSCICSSHFLHNLESYFISSHLRRSHLCSSHICRSHPCCPHFRSSHPLFFASCVCVGHELLYWACKLERLRQQEVLETTVVPGAEPRLHRWHRCVLLRDHWCCRTFSSHAWGKPGITQIEQGGMWGPTLETGRNELQNKYFWTIVNPLFEIRYSLAG